MNEARKRTDQHAAEEDLKFDGLFNNKESSTDGNFANISNIATINFARLEKEFQRIYRDPSQEQPSSVSESNGADELNEANGDDHFCGKTQEKVHGMVNQPSEETLHTQLTGMHNESSIGGDSSKGEGEKRADDCGGTLSAQFERSGPTGLTSHSQQNFPSTNSIELILKSIQENTILETDKGKNGNPGGCNSNVGAGHAGAVDPVRGSHPTNVAKTVSPTALPITLPIDLSTCSCRLWWDDKPFVYHWERGMNRKEVQRCVHNFCINIANEDFYLTRLEKLPEDNLFKEKEKNIQKIQLKGSTYAYYKLCERYEQESLGDVKPNEEYLIRRKNHVEEKLMDPLNFPEVLRAIEYTKEGSNLLKHTVYSIPHLRFFFVSKDLEFIKWFSSRKTDEQCKIYFKKINSLEVKIVHEHMLENLKVDILKRLSFSIVYLNEKKKVTLTCKSLQEFNYWVTTIRALMFRAKRMKTTRSVLLSHVSGGDMDEEEKGNNTLTGEWSNGNAHYAGGAIDVGRSGHREVNSSTSLKPCAAQDPSKWNPHHGEAKSNKMFEGEDASTEEGKSSLKSFHLYKLIVFPDYNLHQIKTKFYLLKEKAYKYRIQIEKEIDEYQMDVDLGGAIDHPVNEGNPLVEDADPHSALTSQINSTPLYHCNLSGNVRGNVAEKENPLRREPPSDGKHNETWPSGSSPHVAPPELYTLNKETNLTIRDGGKAAKGMAPIPAGGEVVDAVNVANIVNVVDVVDGGGSGNPVKETNQNEPEEDTDQFKLQLIVKIYNRIDKKLKKVQKDILHVVKVLKKEESEKQPNPHPQGGSSGFSLEHIWKYTQDAYRTLEGKFYKTGDGRYGGDNRYVRSNDIHTEQRKTELPKQQLRKTELHKRELHKREEQPDSSAPNEWDTPGEKDSPEGRNNQSRKLIHDILFDMWLCEMELGNIEDIYTTYLCNSKRRKNFITNMDAPAFVKNISQQISNTILRYMNL
ncbi:Uncharacterized protein PCOAH_00015060 [Plasmodium coatneyi]|uniref:PH domain-containing protein n=1 Tax=Plasmodium coatneyi TaxID=208452 RepID=A0A1B1DWS2_9APIC|nr:Uncharacterized protein PCOAH_00015060 [Plasmodium coatneyi]ANQ07035.1 Uncharacterized protein PCOAH_00015060 [Plasmodium coatneyi]